MPEAQQMRSAFGDGLLRQIQQLDPHECGSVLGRIDSETLAHYGRVMPVGWSPMSLHMEVSNAIRAVIGPERNIELWRRTMADLTNRPLLAGFLKHVGVRLGVGPGTLYRQNARLWKHLCRGVGDLRADVDERQTLVELTSFPAREHHFPCFVEGLDGCLQGLVAGLDVRPRVEIVDLDLDAGDVRYDVTW